VARPGPLSGDIIVRGAAPEDTRVVVDGMNIPLIYHFGGLRSVIPTPMLEGIDFYPGNFGPRYSRAIGGIVDVRLKRLAPERVGGILDVSFLDTNLYVETPVGDDAAVAVAVRRSYVDFILEQVAGASDSINLVTAPRYYDGQVLAQWRPAPGHELRLFGLFSDDSLRLLFADPGEADLTLANGRVQLATNFYRGIAEYTYAPGDDFRNDLRVSIGEDSSRVQFAQFEFNIGNLAVQVRDEAVWTLSDAFAVTAGVDSLSQQAEGRFFLPPPPREGSVTPPDLDDAIATELDPTWYHSVGAYTELEWKPVGGLSLLPGLRFDHFTRVGDSVLAPRFGARYQVDEQWTAKGGVGLYHQEPPFDETDATFGNPDATTESAVHYALGFEYKPREHLLVDVTGFYKTLYDLMAPSDAIVERDGELVPERVANTGEGQVYGAEILLRHEMTDNFMGWVAYTLMRSERRDRPGEPLRLFSQDQTHILTAVGTYKLPRNWEVSVRWRLVSGNPNTPVSGAVFNADEDEYEPIFGRINSDRIPAFHQLDLRIDKRWIWPYLRFSAYLDIQNVYNRQNPEGVSYSYDYSQQRRAQGLPILPILGLRAEY
jgi:hypothetical protein